jgi:hypothetical protein
MNEELYISPRLVRAPSAAQMEGVMQLISACRAAFSVWLHTVAAVGGKGMPLSGRIISTAVTVQVGTCTAAACLLMYLLTVNLLMLDGSASFINLSVQSTYH